MIDIDYPREKITTINIYHIEDEYDWVEIIQSLIRQYASELHYHHISNSVEAFTYFLEKQGPGIILWDLRLEGENTEYQTTLKLAENLSSLKSKGFEVFVVSGFLHQTTRSLLSKVGILESHIFEKGRRFSRQDFIKNVKQVEERIIEKTVHYVEDESMEFPQDEEIELAAKFIGLEDVDEPILVKENKKYQFSITMRPSNYEYPGTIWNQKIETAICCPKAQISPQVFVFDTLASSQTSTISEVFFEYDPEFETRNFFLMIYHNNRLLQSLVFRLKVLKKQS